MNEPIWISCTCVHPPWECQALTAALPLTDKSAALSSLGTCIAPLLQATVAHPLVVVRVFLFVRL